MTHKGHKNETANDHKILHAALRIAALAGWRRLSFNAVAEEAGVSLSSVLRHYPTRAALIYAWGRQVDKAMLAEEITLDPQETVRDRLFDLIMRRLDALNPHKEAVRALFPTFGRDPTMMAAWAASIDRTMAVTMEAAGIDIIGLYGMLHTKGLKLVYSYTLRAWLKDQTPDMAPTMAALDKALDKADAAANTVFGHGRSKSYGCNEPCGCLDDIQA